MHFAGLRGIQLKTRLGLFFFSRNGHSRNLRDQTELGLGSEAVGMEHPGSQSHRYLCPGGGSQALGHCSPGDGGTEGSEPQNRVSVHFS